MFVLVLLFRKFDLVSSSTAVVSSRSRPGIRTRLGLTLLLPS